MNTENLFFGWTKGQLACVADNMLARGVALPPATEEGALDAMTWWQSNNLHEPGPNVVLMTDVLGRELPPTGRRPDAERWARHAMGRAAIADIKRRIPNPDWRAA